MRVLQRSCIKKYYIHSLLTLKLVPIHYTQAWNFVLDAINGTFTAVIFDTIKHLDRTLYRLND